MQPEEKFPRRIFGAENADGFQVAEGKLAREPIAQRLRQIAHLRKRTDALLVDPIHDLFRAVRALVVGGEKRRNFVEEERVDGASGGRLHD